VCYAPGTYMHLRHLLAVLAPALLTGCPNTEDEFCAFDDRSKEAAYAPCLADCEMKPDDEAKAKCRANCDTAHAIGTCETPAIPASCDTCAMNTTAGEADGDYLFTLTTNLGPTTPILFDTKLEVEDDGGNLKFTLTATPLDASDRMTTVGNEFTIGPFTLGQGFCLDGTTSRIELPGAANPISGCDVAAVVQLVASVCSPTGFICGTIPTGSAFLGMAEIPINGSTFTLERLSAPGVYPDPPKLNCEMDLADPAPMPMCTN
jgi:hypothetical protein